MLAISECQRATQGYRCSVAGVFGSLKWMEVHFTPEQEAQLEQLASQAGTDPERLVKGVILRMLEVKAYAHSTKPELPVWHLGAIGSLHRRDIYNDVD